MGWFWTDRVSPLVPDGSVEVRPPPGLARGLLAVPPWAVLGVAGAVVLAVAVYFLWRARRERRS